MPPLRTLRGGGGAAPSVELDGRLQWVRVGPDLCDVSRLDEVTDLFYDAGGPSRSIAGRAVWLHDYLKVTLPGELRGPEEERLVCTMLGMTEASYEYVSGTAANVYGDEDYF